MNVRAMADNGVSAAETPPSLDSTLGILKDLIAFDTVSVRSNLAIAGYIVDLLKAESVEARTLPGTDTAALNARIDAVIDAARARLAAQAPEAGITVETLSDYPGLDTPADSAAVRLVSALVGSNEAPVTLAFGTEAGLYHQAGIATVVCGPGDIARARKADEWIGLDELAAACALMQRLAARLGAPLDTFS